MSLLQELRAQIAAEGPLSVAAYMARCLTDPDHGYYLRREPFGRAGDFITAPEISQLFGEMVAVWCLTAWERIGAPRRFTLLEPGPGRGTLMADVLRVAARYPAFMEAADVVLLEASPRLREAQRRALGGHAVRWHGGPGLPEGAEGAPLIVIANEFFDALPIRQFERFQGIWRERLVGLSGEGLGWRLSPGEAAHPLLPDGAEDGAIWEVSDAALALAGEMAGRIARDGGAALWIDYGHEGGGFGDTFQAVKAHAYHPVLEAPGEADLTAHVNFAHLAGAAEEAGAVCGPLITQRQFLMNCGIFERAARLLQTAGEGQKKALLAGLDRLTSPEAMGTLFKVLQVYGSA